jgi:ectoine hydroxylase-related dioxygenase (phytanoyl-CoA dioxygenase family)
MVVTEKLVEKLEIVGEFEVSNDLLNQPNELRKRLAESGYLFFRGLLDSEALLKVRRDILTLCQESGWIKTGSSLMEGLFRGGSIPDYNSEYMTMYRKLIKMDSFNAFSRSPEIMALFKSIFESDVLAHPRNIARVTFPKHHFATQPHQDFHYIRGTPETYTAWIPAGDCPRELGGVAVLDGSQRLGFLKHEPAIGAGGNGLRTGKMGLRWLFSDFRLGDVVIFHSYTIHGALDNITAEQMRVSLDFRYQRVGDEIDPSSLLPHGG